MKKLIGITLVALAISGCKSEIDNAETVNRNGLIYKYGETDPFTGLVLNAPTGIQGISALCNFQVEKGRYSGESECFYNSKKVYEVEFSAGNKEGTETVFDAETGKAKSVKNWKNNRLNGTAKEYLNGNLVSQKEYKDGLQDGDEVGWSEDGQTKLTDITWSNGKEQDGFKTYFNTGFDTYPSGKYNYLNGKLDGQQLTYSRTNSGKQFTLIEKYYKNGKLDGTFKEYFNVPNSDVIHQKLEVLYKNDDPVSGWFKQYSSIDGRFIQEIKLIRAPNDDGKGFYDDYPGTLVPDGLIKKYNELLDRTTGEELWVNGVKVDHNPQTQEAQESTAQQAEEIPQKELLANSAQALAPEGCLDAWIAAYRKEIGEDAMIVSEQIDEWKGWCSEGKQP